MVGLVSLYVRHTLGPNGNATKAVVLVLSALLWSFHWLHLASPEFVDVARAVYLSLLCFIFLAAISDNRSTREIAAVSLVALVLFQIVFGTGLFISMWMSAPLFWLLILLWPLVILVFTARTIFVVEGLG